MIRVSRPGGRMKGKRRKKKNVGTKEGREGGIEITLGCG
jgi:hypothetical protein